MNDNNSKTLIWDNIPEWAIYSLEYGVEEDLFLTDEDKKRRSLKLPWNPSPSQR